MEKFSMVDYDGYIACTVFTPGCNFRCPFCHNASLVTEEAVLIDENEVFSYLAKRKGLVDAVCITGGEPTLQPDLESFIRKMRALGYRVKLDTNGTNPETLEKMIGEGLLDYVAMDIKSDFDGYFEAIGIPAPALIEKLKRSVEILKSAPIDYEFRTTAIREFHSEKNFARIAEIVRGAKRFFIQKFKESETNLTQGILHELPEADAKIFLATVQKTVAFAGLRGY